MFAQLSTDQIAQGFGWQAAVVIVGLITALLWFVRQDSNKAKKIDELQDKAVLRAETVTDGVVAPMKELKESSDRNYELLVSVINKRGK